MSFLELDRTLGFKLESPAYSAATLAATDYDLSAYNIKYDPDIAMYARKLARGDLSQDVSIAGKRTMKISFSVDVGWSGTAATPPTYYKVLKACAMKQNIHGATGVSLVTHAEYTNVPATIEVVEKAEGTSPSQVVVKARGCMGNAKLALDSVGQPLRIDFDFTGVLDSITDRAYGSILVPTGFDTPLPDAVLGVTMSVFGEVQTLDKVTIDLGNTVEVYSDPSKAEGVIGAHITGRKPTMEIDPDLQFIAANGDFARWTGNTTGALVMEIGDNIVASAPACQIIKGYNPGARQGHVTNTKNFELKRSSGNDEFEILQGTK